MVDPLSIAEGIVTFGDIVKKIIVLAMAVKSAGKEEKQMLAKVAEEMRFIDNLIPGLMKAIEEAEDQGSISSDSLLIIGDLGRIMEKSCISLKCFEKIYKSKILSESKWKKIKQSITWTSRKQKLHQMLRDIEDCKQSLILALGAAHL